ncbi:opioid-binding protein/cell adhesion molecule homolog [Diadema antillarum]|uniref:opioid-binding protein/cell adhesion molecule homolog n=1 Tax=Diadema antillarum TaxID=105358 RepID=UPI003A84048A
MATCSWSSVQFQYFLYLQVILFRASDQTSMTSISNVAVETGTVVITCTYHFDPFFGESLYQLRWGRADTTLSLAMYNCKESSCNEHNATPRYTLSITHDAILHSNLTIASLTLADTGTYTCTVTTTGGIFTGSVQLNVEVCAASVSLSPCRAILAGDPTELKCATNWTRPFSVTEFLHQGATIAEISQRSSDLSPALTSGGAAVNLTFGRNDHESEMICCAKKISSCASSCSDPCTLNIVYPPEILAYNDSVKADEGTELTLRCQVNSNPEADVIWYHAGAVASNAAWQRSSVRHVESQRESIIHSLFIGYVIPERDYGTFTCVARNSEGIDERSFNVFGSAMVGAEEDDTGLLAPKNLPLFASVTSGAGLVIIILIVIICVMLIRRTKAKKRNAASKKPNRKLPARPAPVGKLYDYACQENETNVTPKRRKTMDSDEVYAEIREQTMDPNRDRYMPMTSSHVRATSPYMSFQEQVDSRRDLFSDQGYVDSQTVFYETRHPSLVREFIRQEIDTTYM